MKKFHILSVGSGAILLIYLVWKIGVSELWHELTVLGWGLVPLILIEGITDLFHAAGWRFCLSGAHRSLPFMRIFRIRMAGFAINHLTPTASLGGEVAKGALLSGEHKSPEAVTGVLIGKLAFAISQLLFVAFGSILVLSRIQLPAALWIGMLVSSTLLFLGIIGFLLIQKYGKLGSLIRWLVARRMGGNLLRRLSNEINEVDNALKLFYARHPTSLPISISWHIAGFGVGIIKTWYFLLLLNAHASIPVAAGIWFLSTWFDLLTFAIPFDLGVQEGTRVIAFKALGFDLVTGMTYGVTLRLEQIFWALFGLLNYALLLSEKRVKSSPSGRRNGSFFAFWGCRRGRE